MSSSYQGKKWPSEMTVSKDPISGAKITQFTDYLAHSRHNYFTHPVWYDGGRKLIIYSDRENSPNMYGIDLETGEMTQLNDPAVPIGGCVKNPVREEVFYGFENSLYVLDLATLESRFVYKFPDGYTPGGADVTADGKYIVTGASEDLSDRIQIDLGHGYIGFNEIWEAKPHSFVWKVPIDGGEAQMMLEDRCWLGHFNASSKLPDLMTFCHEGPWHRVDNRIWGMNVATGEVWKIRPTAEGETVGHEYWMKDGERIGYHGRNPQGEFYGSIRHDNADRVEAPFNGHSWHFHGQSIDLVVGDGSAEDAYLLAWRLDKDTFDGPKVLAWHRGSFHTQQLHVHPCVHAGGNKVLYTADPQGYGQVFIVDVPDWDSLPYRKDVTKSKEV